MLRKLISLGALALLTSTALAGHKMMMQITSETRNGGKRATFEVLQSNAGGLQTDIVKQNLTKGDEFKKEGSGKDKPVVVDIKLTPESEAFFKDAVTGEKLSRLRLNFYNSKGTDPLKPYIAYILYNPIVLSIMFKREAAKPMIQVRFDYEKLSWVRPKQTDATDDWENPS